MRADKRIWRTMDGRLVAEGHRDAAFLAYAVGDDVDSKDEPNLPGVKSRAPSQNKMGAKPEDKSQDQAEVKAEAPKAADVRSWAESEGLEVPKRGRVPDEVVEAYLKRGE